MAHALLNSDSKTDVPATHRLSAPDAVPEILYIMGTGRSGTTILEVLLTSSERIVGSGELKHIVRDGFIRDVQCSCGQPTHECALWSKVLEHTRWSREECAEIAATIERIEGHRAFASVWLGTADERSIKRHRETTERIFRSIRRATGADVVVDSSKYPSRALLLDRAFPDKVRVVCMTRSAQGLLAAFRKQNEGEQRPKSTWAATAYYLYVLCCMRLVRAKLKDRCFVIRFEDLKRDPIATLRAIEEWSGYSFAGSTAKIAAGEHFDVGHIVTGNRLRKRGRVQFDASSSSKEGGGRAVLASLLETYRNLLGF